MIKTRNRNPCCDIDENIMTSIKSSVSICKVCGSESSEITYIMDDKEWYDFKKKAANNLMEMANHFKLNAEQTINLVGGHPVFKL